jgi:hypothetical protein
VKRFLIPLERPLVVLDTSPVRNIAHSDVIPTWVGAFARMRGSGYVICLADGAFAELLTQRCEGRIDEAGHQRMISSLRQFLDRDVPVLPGKVDILAMLGLRKQQKYWSAKEVRTLSQTAWKRLATAKAGDPCAAVELDDERGAYRTAFKELERAWEASDKSVALDAQAHPQLDIALAGQRDHGRIKPDMDVRNDLQVRWLWRQFVRSQLAKDAYNPESPKKRNDGIDFDLYSYLALPALIVATDAGFFEKIADIYSPQKSWLWKPEPLAAAFESGARPQARWPE